jgi:hypothetical protein
MGCSRNAMTPSILTTQCVLCGITIEIEPFRDLWVYRHARRSLIAAQHYDHPVIQAWLQGQHYGEPVYPEQEAMKKVLEVCGL